MQRSLVQELSLLSRLLTSLPRWTPVYHTTLLAIFDTNGQRSLASFAIGPLIMVPLGLPISSLSTTAALSSKRTRIPSRRRYGILWRTITAGTTCFLISGFPSTTEHITKSPTPAEGFLPLTVFAFFTLIILKIRAPLLSAATTFAVCGRPLVTFALTAFIFFLLDLFDFLHLAFFHELLFCFKEALAAEFFSDNKFLGFTDWATFHDLNNISFLCINAWRIVNLHARPSILKTLVLTYILSALPFNNCSKLHACSYNNTSKCSSASSYFHISPP